MRTTAPAAAPIFRSEQQTRVLAALFEVCGVELSEYGDFASRP